MIAHDAEDVIHFMVGETCVPCQLNTGLDPDLALLPVPANVNMPLLIEIEAEETNPIRDIRDRDARHGLERFAISLPRQFQVPRRDVF